MSNKYDPNKHDRVIGKCEDCEEPHWFIPPDKCVKCGGKLIQREEQDE